MSSVLSNYYRKPGIAINLPSRGKWYTDDDIEMSLIDDIEVYPLTAKDEIILNNPDALMNGRAEMDIFQSCVPAFKNVENMVYSDYEALMLAIKAISYEGDLEISTKCPKCESENIYTFNIPALLDNLKEVPHDTEVTLETGLVVHIKQAILKNIIRVRHASFKETKKLEHYMKRQVELINDAKNKDEDGNTNEKAQKLLDDIAKDMKAIYKSLDDIKKSVLANNIIKITTPTGESETSQEEIMAFIANISRKDFKSINDAVHELNSFKPYDSTQKVVCNSKKCKHEWELEVETNPVNFFTGSSQKATQKK